MLPSGKAKSRAPFGTSQALQHMGLPEMKVKLSREGVEKEGAVPHKAANSVAASLAASESLTTAVNRIANLDPHSKDVKRSITDTTSQIQTV